MDEKRVEADQHLNVQIVNEDRHLTTLLLLHGWRVIYAGDIMTETESPVTLVRWIRQQVGDHPK